VSELRLFLQREGLLDGNACAWALLGRDGLVQRSGASLDDAPRAGTCRLVLSGEQVATLSLPLPRLPERKLTPLLANAVESRSLEEAESLHAVFSGWDRAGQGVCQVLSAPWLERALARLAEAGIHPAEAVPEWALLPHQPGEWTVLLHEAGCLVRFDEQQGMALDAGDPPQGLRLALAARGRPDRVRIFTGSRLNAPEVEQWQAVLGVPVIMAEAWDWRTAPWTGAISLLSGRFAPRRGRKETVAVLRPLGLGLLGLEHRNLRAEQIALAQQVLPAGAAIVDPAFQIGQMLQRLQGGAGSAGDDMSTLLTDLGRAWPGLPGPVLSGLLYSEGTLQLEFASRQADWLGQLETSLQAMGYRIGSEPSGQGGVTLRILGAITPRGGAADGP